MEFESNSAEETAAFGMKLAQAARPGDVYCLHGALGVGKTVFSQGFARGLGITEPVSSPTFTIVQEYDGGRLPFYHMDVYRISDSEEMYEVGFDDMLMGGGVCLIEWADLISDLLPDKYYSVTIEKDSVRGFDYRRIEVLTKGGEL
ncbi:MAG: tRNA (adenosine(37)-N6)-threonylcarbamoyltransferase complex ATPase subunit type 1 TsaE [Lachnospiraceae bacterium]|nr:tRNA (adenosine(37)-N6)-threonylcarbamoyltransferase complex ATPase subunit type 1 TsaE [Lachnospiraceae bacterium]